VLAERLGRLVDEGIVVKHAYSQRPVRFDYLLTDKGWQLCDVLLAITAWGDRWTMADAGPPALLRHHSCGQVAAPEIRCSRCGRPMAARDIEVVPQR
jgi:DNA-binding HxlR family transcriptional regulator